MSLYCRLFITDPCRPNYYVGLGIVNPDIVGLGTAGHRPIVHLQLHLIALLGEQWLTQRAARDLNQTSEVADHLNQTAWGML